MGYHLKTILLIFYLNIQLTSLVNAKAERTKETEQGHETTDQMAKQTAYLDLSLIISSQERSDWIIDELALQQIIPKLAEVLCQIKPEIYQALISRLKTESVRRGKSKAYWMKEGGKLGFTKHRVFKEILHKERMLLSLEYFQVYLKQCPFWLPINPSFLGVHRDAGRLQILAETMGGLQLQKNQQDVWIGGAAQGRLILVYGLAPSWGMGIGLEAGGASTFPKSENGGRSVKAQWTAGIPILLRSWIDNMRLDTEITPVARFNDDHLIKGSYGVRFAVGFGVSPLRVFGALPHLMAWVGGEQFFDDESTTVLRVGTRIGFSL